MRFVFQTLLLAATCSWSFADNDAMPVRSKSSSNFLVSAPTDALAQALLDRAEQLRKQIAQEWLGRRLPESVGHAVVDVFISQEKESALTSASRDLRRPTFMIWITVRAENTAGALLDHEVVHVVLNTRYPRFPVWADEGIACRYDDNEAKNIRLDVLQWFKETGNWPSLKDVLTAETIRSWDQASFAVSSSLVEFFLSRGDRTRLIGFVVDGSKRGWETALREHYQIGGMAVLEKAWQEWVSKKR